MKPDRLLSVLGGKEIEAMLITMLAAAMTFAMLIATAFGFYEEAQRARQSVRAEKRNPFGVLRRH